jgi:predicted metal-dependent enzyme (double-stranded beta helix superfamily)
VPARKVEEDVDGAKEEAKWSIIAEDSPKNCPNCASVMSQARDL